MRQPPGAAAGKRAGDDAVLGPDRPVRDEPDLKVDGFAGNSSSSRCARHRSAAGGPAVAFAGFPAEGNGVKMFNENPREDSLAERRTEPASL
jgi:hypothetical protein